MNVESTGSEKSSFCNHHSKDQFRQESMDAKYGENTVEEQNMHMVLKLPFMGCLFITREKNSNGVLETWDNTLTVWRNYVHHQWVGRHHVPSGVIPQGDQCHSHRILTRNIVRIYSWGNARQRPNEECSIKKIKRHFILQKYQQDK